MQACVDLHRWQRHEHHSELEICVNISTPQLMAPDFAATVAEVLAETRTDPRLVTLEMTESVFIQDSDRALIVLHDLRRLGVKLALDDFGTGYSSLSYLRQFPVNIVKIDRAFIADLGSEPTSRLIVSAIVRLAHSLQMTVVAEGIESAHQYEEVVALDCDSYQGYFFARPASAEVLDSLMATTEKPPRPPRPEPRGFGSETLDPGRRSALRFSGPHADLYGENVDVRQFPRLRHACPREDAVSDSPEPVAEAVDPKVLLSVLAQVKFGDFTARMPLEWTGVAGKVADGLNDVIIANQALEAELARVSEVVGEQGRLSRSASSWAARPRAGPAASSRSTTSSRRWCVPPARCSA